MRNLPRKIHCLLLGFRDGHDIRRVSSTSGKRTKKRSRAFLIAPLLAGALLGTVVDSLAVGGKGMAALVRVVQDPLSLFAQRSPGERGAGALLSTKGARRGPTEQVLAPAREVVPPAEAQPFAGLADPELPALAYLGVPEGAPVVAPPFFGGVPVGPVGFFGGGSPGIPGPIGGGGGGGGGGVPPLTPPVVTPEPPGPPGPPIPPGPPSPPLPIPEPATWLTMLIGFFATGLIVRRRAARVSRHSIG